MEQKKERGLKEIVATRIEFFKRKPEAAIYKPKVSSRHVRGLYTETKVREHVVKSDYGEAAGGTNLAPNPIELLLSALAACIEAAFYEFAEHEGVPVQSLSVEVEGTLDLRGLFMVDESVAPGFQDLKYTFTIESAEDEAKVMDLARRVVDHCPVFDSLKRPLNISGDIQVKKP
ncbi:MAG: OsmC family protein [Alphaproteobacteria bacterium]|uniref:OsmC family protein n=1 Tax=Candidatus Nitrobium versatile TaxID=2884831 RepID=A0A953M128_9BACT|nr:OsmC family protein [Candidatus Nitrobium versatile]